MEECQPHRMAKHLLCEHTGCVGCTLEITWSGSRNHTSTGPTYCLGLACHRLPAACLPDARNHRGRKLRFDLKHRGGTRDYGYARLSVLEGRACERFARPARGVG